MESVLDLYNAEPSPDRARITFDEKPCQLLDNTVEPLLARPGSTKKVDHEYVRKGVANVLLAYDIEQGTRFVQVTKQRTKREFALFFYTLITTQYAHKAIVDVVLDNLNTHQYGSFYDYLELDQAEMLRRKINFVYTPKHGSWLNMTEIEFSALAIQCLKNKRIPTIEALQQEVLHWKEQRNADRRKVNWTFTTQTARTKLAKHYENLQVIKNKTCESDY